MLQYQYHITEYNLPVSRAQWQWSVSSLFPAESFIELILNFDFLARQYMGREF